MRGRDEPEARPIEIPTQHRCLLGEITDALAAEAARGVRGKALAAHAKGALSRLFDGGLFERCCLPAYLALAPERFGREIQVPIARADEAQLDTRVLLWPIGASDGQHPHCDGWAAFMAVRGDLVESEERAGQRLPEQPVVLRTPKVLVPEQDVSHHIHNAGDEIGLTIHVFGT